MMASTMIRLDTTVMVGMALLTAQTLTAGMTQHVTLPSHTRQVLVWAHQTSPPQLVLLQRQKQLIPAH